MKGKPRLNSKLDAIRDETELSVDENVKTIKNFFKSIGYMPMGKIKKSRESFVKKDVKISIDKVKGLGLFLEIEVKNKCEKGALIKLKEYKEILNLKDKDVIKQGYFDLQNKNGCKLFYQIMKNIDKENFAVEIPKNVKVKRISENILEIREVGSYFIGFLNPIEIRQNENKLNIRVLKK